MWLASKKSSFQHLVATSFSVALALLLVWAFSPANAAVTVSSFTAQATSTQIHLAWSTATELNNAGFNLLRKSSSDANYSPIGGYFPSKSLGSIIGANYSYDDLQVTNGLTYSYRLESVDRNGAIETFDASPVKFGVSTATPTVTRVPPTATRTNTPPPTQPLATPTIVATAQPTPVPTATPTWVGAILPTGTLGQAPVVPTAAPKVAAVVAAPAVPTRAPAQAAAPQQPTAPDADGTLGGPIGIAADQSQAGGVVDITQVDSVGNGTVTGETLGPRRAAARLRVVLGIGMYGTSASFVLGSIVLGALAIILFARSNIR